jgi:hypothetical protein
MAPPRRFVALGFASVHDAMAAESALKTAGVSVTAIPSPRALGELCGIALRIAPQDVEAAEAVLAQAGVPPRVSAEIHDV